MLFAFNDNGDRPRCILDCVRRLLRRTCQRLGARQKDVQKSDTNPRMRLNMAATLFAVVAIEYATCKDRPAYSVKEEGSNGHGTGSCSYSL